VLVWVFSATLLVVGFFCAAVVQRGWREREIQTATEKSKPTVAARQPRAHDGAKTSPATRILRGHQNPVSVVAMGSQGQALLSGDTAGEIRVWDFYAGQQLSLIDAADLSLRRVILTPEGRHVIACGNNPTIRLWKLATGEFVRDFQGHTAGVTAVRWIPHSRRFISSSFDSSLILWNSDSGKIERQFGTAPNAREFAPNTLEELSHLEGHFTWIRDVVVLPDGQRGISAGNEAVLFVWDLETGHLVNRLVGHLTVVMGLALAADGRFVASLGSDREIIVWNIDESRILQRWQHPREKLPAFAFVPNTRTLAVGGDDGLVRFVDVESGGEQRKVEVTDVEINSLAFSFDSEIICGCADGLIRIRPIESEK
jgi:WD40 repeat protein